MRECDERAVIRDPERELYHMYQQRVKPFIEMEDTSKIQQYEAAWKIARDRLAKVQPQEEDHAL